MEKGDNSLRKREKSIISVIGMGLAGDRETLSILSKKKGLGEGMHTNENLRGSADCS